MHSVVLSRPEWVDVMTVAKALAAARATPVQDQMNAARAAWGILAENLSQADAAALAERLSAGGLMAQAVAQETIAALPAALPTPRLQPTDSGWSVYSAGNQVHTLESAHVALIAAARVKITSTVTTQVKEGPGLGQKMINTSIMMATGLPIKFGGKEKMVEKKREESDDQFTLDLVTHTPERRFRITAAQFDYAYLKERKQYVSLGNFKLVLGDLAKASPGGIINHGARILMENKPLQTMGYTSLTDLERESRWLLTLAARQRCEQGDGQK